MALTAKALLEQRKKLEEKLKQLEADKTVAIGTELRNVHASKTLEQKDERGQKYLLTDYKYLQLMEEVRDEIIRIDNILWRRIKRTIHSKR